MVIGIISLTLTMATRQIKSLLQSNSNEGIGLGELAYRIKS